MISLSINGQTHAVDVEEDTPLLWVLRDTIGLTGTKYGCGIAQCGACTVHVDGVAMRSCSIPAAALAGKQITTIEAIADQRQAQRRAAGLARQRRAAMRLLPERHDHGGDGAAQAEAQADRRRHRCSDHQYLPLRHLSADPRGHSCRCQRVTEAAMTYMPRINRRSFVVGAAAAGGGLALGLRLPFGPKPLAPPTAARGQCLGGDPSGRQRGDPRRPLRDGPGHAHGPRPARFRRARMRLVESRRPNSRRPGRTSPASACGAISRPAAARASASRTNMSARAAPPPAQMLIQAAANAWSVPASECSAANSVITHKPDRPHHDLRQGRRRRRQDRAAQGHQAQGPSRTGRSPARASSASTPTTS